MDLTIILQRICSHRRQSSTNIKITVLLITYLLNLSPVTTFIITGRYCKQNVSIKYQESVMHTTQPARRSIDLGNEIESSFTPNKNESYVTYEPRVRWEIKSICCPGYRPLLLGFCEPICETPCPRFSYCATPNQCECLSGYEEYHPNNKEKKLLDCHPVCENGCPTHSRCMARNRCECREGYIDSSSWFMPMKCQRIRCPALDQRYDVEQRMCVKIEMSMEDLMKKVAERLSKGLTDFALEDGEDGDEDEEDRKNDEKDEENEVVKETRKNAKTEG